MNQESKNTPNSTIDFSAIKEEQGHSEVYVSPKSTDDIENIVPIEITLDRVSFTVTETRFCGLGARSSKQILHPLSGVMKPGELWAVMGPSGSGKSTLLNVIANRMSQKNLDGSVLANGKPVSKEISREFGYVMQDDVLFENLTVRETLEYVIRLRNGWVNDKVAIEKKIFSVSEELGLLTCLDTRIGGFLTRGLSGGEKKRVSIAIELLKEQSSVLLLDEPSSGLDSATAYNILSTLRQLASQRNRVVICTIHQPHSKIYKLFDKVLLLSQGRCIYMGEGSKALDYFGSLGYPPMSHTNPSDHILDLVTLDSRNPEALEESQKRIDYFANEFLKSEMKLNGENLVLESLKSSVVSGEHRAFSRFTPIIFVKEWFRFLILCSRNFKEQYRAKLSFIFRLTQAVAFALIVGAFYWQIPPEYNSIFDLQGVIFFVSLQQSIAAIFLVLNVFQSEKRIYFREYHQGLYSSISYYAARVISEIPLFLPVPIIYAGIVFPMVGLRLEYPYFAIAVLCLVVVNFTSQSMGFMISSLSPSNQVSNIVTPLVLSLLLLFGGLFVNIANIPVYFSWVGYFNYVRYAYESTILIVLAVFLSIVLSFNEFYNLPITCDPATLDQYKVCPITNGTQVLTQMSMDNVNIVSNFVYLVILTCGFHLISFSGLRFSAFFE